MKQITDEEIETAAQNACRGIEDEDQLRYALKDFRRGAKFAREHQKGEIEKLESWLTKYRDELKRSNVFHTNQGIINEINKLIGS